mmetsp:Transcript_23554/g.36334  ORF Transcript_23554/g.36334 Transcript_23554/m.36334 type:complete len:439 (+) Transcript_23554:89-1405(+)|eukprot:CAMPEP_0196813254 /NCGR_PEP_ID=MMETSP1362-20130617/35124_1 /TAXON_ID=163516 /ORGANISM="Leptocylindrus danicus, Strain CCMP1856" /LENGTH=438 /DNA_ID=CAMNT_0042189367 /DNA_START=18 /DNA_END=1334 /DNA_ORIENTATION=-
MSYETTKQSIEYTNANHQMKDGEFEMALATLIDFMGVTRANCGDNEMHESMAPLYYLYGTTLLYSVEESDDMVANSSAVPIQSTMMQQEDSKAEDDDGKRAGEDGPTKSFASTVEVPQDDDAEQTKNDEEAAMALQHQEQQEQQAEDLQIAWENLEMARTILVTIMNVGFEDVDKIMDLAQIYNRLGDLQKANRNYAGAIEDYVKCLDVRKRILGNFDRLVADCHYSIGSCCLECASEGAKPMERTGVEALDSVTANQTALSPEEISEYKNRGVKHYLSCARSLAGLIEDLCGETPSPPEGEKESGGSSSAAMQRIRLHVSKLRNPAQQDTISDLKEFLDEIQETIDHSDETQEVMEEHVSKFKAQAEAEAEADANGTTALSSTSATTTIGFGAAAASKAATAVAAPMMMVKRKKKREDTNEEQEEAAPTSKKVSTSK